MAKLARRLGHDHRLPRDHRRRRPGLGTRGRGHRQRDAPARPGRGLSDSHARSLLAVHDASPGELATAMPAFRRRPLHSRFGGDAKVRDGARASRSNRPAIVAVAVRGRTLALAAIVRVSVPLPAPAPGLTIIQARSLLAVHGASSIELVSPTFCRPPFASALQVPGVTAKVGIAPSCVTVTGRPAIVTVAVRGWTLMFGAAVNVTAPLPVPDPGLTVNHAGASAAPSRAWTQTRAPRRPGSPSPAGPRSSRWRSGAGRSGSAPPSPSRCRCRTRPPD